jgi:hypothetical protein
LNLAEKGCAEIESEELDIISLDLDANDIFFEENFWRLDLNQRFLLSNTTKNSQIL